MFWSEFLLHFTQFWPADVLQNSESFCIAIFCALYFFYCKYNKEFCSTIKYDYTIFFPVWHYIFMTFYPLCQGSPHSVLEGWCPAEFSSNLPQHTCLEVSSIPSKTLISWFRCVWLGWSETLQDTGPPGTSLVTPALWNAFCAFKFGILF